MKKLITLLLLSHLVSFSQAPINKSDLKQLRAMVPKCLKVRADYFEKCFWVSTRDVSFLGSKNILNGRRVLHRFYFRVEKIDSAKFSRSPMMYRLDYTSSDWLFIESVDVLCAESNNATRHGEGNKYEIVIDDGSPDKTVNRDATITEVYDILAPEGVIGWLTDASKDKFSRMRINGKNSYAEEVIRAHDLQEHAAAILKAYEILKN